MIRDTIRAALIVAVMAAAAGLLVEVRHQLAAIDLAHRSATAGHYAAPPQAYAAPPNAPAPPGPLRRFGRAAIDMAEAAIGVVR
jgi:hypothetical protein